MNQAIKTNCLLTGIVLLTGMLLPFSVTAAVVTDNNLISTSRPGLTNTANTTATISNFATVTNRLVVLRTTTTFLSGSSPANGYYIDNVTPGGGYLQQTFSNPMSQYI